MLNGLSVLTLDLIRKTYYGIPESKTKYPEGVYLQHPPVAAFSSSFALPWTPWLGGTDPLRTDRLTAWVDRGTSIPGLLSKKSTGEILSECVSQGI